MKHKIIVLITHFLAFIVPRSRNIWVFGGNRGLRFADNSRYMFIYASRNTDKKCIWLSQDKNIVMQIREMGYTAYLPNELLGLYYGFRAKWHIFDISIGDTGGYNNSKGAYLLDLWHGMPIKNLANMFNPTGNINMKYFFSFANKEFQYTILNAFDVAKENMVVSNLPRNIVFSIDENEKKSYELKAEKVILENLRMLKKEGAKVLGYFPTWRDHGAENFMNIESMEELKKLNQLLVDNNAYILTKRHTCSFKEYKHSGYSEKSDKNEITLESFSNFITMGFDIDLNAVITECDMLISDYSGVVLDYLLTNNPMILYVYDLKKYQNNPGLYYNYDEYKFGHQAFTMDELIQHLKFYFSNTQEFVQEFKEDRKKLQKKFFDTEECFEPIIKILEGR